MAPSGNFHHNLIPDYPPSEIVGLPFGAIGQLLQWSRQLYSGEFEIPVPPAFYNYCNREAWADKPKTVIDLPDTPVGISADGAPPPQPPAHPRRPTPRLKGMARRDHILSQSGMAEKLADKKVSAAAISGARERLSANYMARSTIRSAETARSIGEGVVCPECEREFSSIWAGTPL